jgi:outer membrane protein assembly factor BamB
MTRRPWLALAPGLLLIAGPAPAGDWVHWRGPEQTGVSREVGLPDSFGLDTPGQNGLLWRQPYGGRSAPLVLKGRVYTIGGYDMSLPTEGERVLCFDAETGKLLWENRFNVFHTDIVSSRLGWTTLTADPENERIYAHSTGGFLFCFDKDGKEIWRHSLTEEFGRVTGYGGRIVSPIFDSGLVIVSMISSSWGNHARGATRFLACDGNTGEIVWWGETPFPIKGTYYSNPVIAVIGGQRLMITGGGDGYVHAFKVRTGERVWSYRFSAGVVNPSPVVEGNYVYIAHGEENPEGGPIGRVICLDASRLVPVKGAKGEREPTLVWEQKRLAKRFGLSSPALFDGRLYMPDDSSELFCFNARTGKPLWRQKYGTVSRGAPLIADGKLYVFDVNAKLAIFKLKGDEEPEELDPIPIRRESGVGFVETHGTPIAVNGKLYFLTQDHLYCIGKPGTTSPEYRALSPETPFNETAPPAGVRIFPADVTASSAAKLTFTLKFLDANGREVKAPADARIDWSLPQPPLPKGADPKASPPPALNAELKAAGATAGVNLGKLPRQQGYVAAKVSTLTAPLARVRVAARVPYSEDFEKTPLRAAPAGWNNVQNKFVVVEKDGSRVLLKVNTDSRPPFARANGYITDYTARNYAIEADIMGTEVRGRFPDAGLVNSRYTLILDGKSGSPSGKRQVRIVSWEARPRVNVAAEFDWQPGVWYHARLSVEPGEKTGLVRAKIWKRGDAEPGDWTLSYVDPSPNREGAAALYAYIPDPSISVKNPGSEVYFDNVSITPNK